MIIKNNIIIFIILNLFIPSNWFFTYEYNNQLINGNTYLSYGRSEKIKFPNKINKNNNMLILKKNDTKTYYQKTIISQWVKVIYKNYLKDCLKNLFLFGGLSMAFPFFLLFLIKIFFPLFTDFKWKYLLFFKTNNKLFNKNFTINPITIVMFIFGYILSFCFFNWPDYCNNQFFKIQFIFFKLKISWFSIGLFILMNITFICNKKETSNKFLETIYGKINFFSWLIFITICIIQYRKNHEFYYVILMEQYETFKNNFDNINKQSEYLSNYFSVHKEKILSDELFKNFQCDVVFINKKK